MNRGLVAGAIAAMAIAAPMSAQAGVIITGGAFTGSPAVSTIDVQKIATAAVANVDRSTAKVVKPATVQSDNTAVRLPETATWAMMILGFFGLTFAVRRRGDRSMPRVRFS